MHNSERAAVPGGVFQKLVLTLVPLGLLLYGLIKGTDADLHFVIGAAAGFLVYIVTFIDLTLGLAILIACVGLSPELSIGGIQNLRLEDFVVPALLVSWVTKRLQQRIPLAPLLVFPALPLYAGGIVLSTLLGVASGTTAFSTSVLFMGKFLEFFLIYVLLVNNVRQREEFRALATFTLLVALASALMVASSFAGSEGTRMNGPLGETANMYGGYLILNLSLAVGLFLHASSTSGRMLAGAAIVFLGIPLLYTYSRTSFAAIVVATLLFGFLKDRRLLGLAAVVGVMTLIAAPESILNRIVSISGVANGDTPSSWESRTYAWEMLGKKTALESPLMGFGLASVQLGMVDNEYVRVFIDTGIVGLGLFLWVLARLALYATRAVDRLRPETFERGYASGYWIAFVAMAVHAIGATSYTSIRTMECFIVLTGLFGALNNHLAEWGLGQSVASGGGVILVDASPALEPHRQ